MFRNIIAVIAGIVVAGVTVALVEGIGHWLFPPPADLDTSDMDQLRAYAENAPASAMLIVILAWTLGTFTGGLAAAWMGQRKAWLFVSIVAVIVALSALANLLILPHPLWFGVVAFAGIVIAALVAIPLARHLPPVKLPRQGPAEPTDAPPQ